MTPIKKLKENGEVFVPATRADAVINKETGNTVEDDLKAIDGRMVVVTSDEYDMLKAGGQIKDDVFYFIPEQ